MHTQHSLVALESSNLNPKLAAAARSPFHQSSSSSRCQPLSSLSCRKAAFSSHVRNQRFCGVDSLLGPGFGNSSCKRWPEVPQSYPRRQQQCPSQGLIRVPLRKDQLRTRRHSKADTEADSIEDLNLEDLDKEQLDDLFETYGEVVKGESEPTPISSEVDDDAESLALAVSLAEVAHEVKAGEIQVLCVKPLVYWTRFFVIATGFSRPQVDAIGTRMRGMAEERFKRTPRGDLKPNAWTLLDFGDVVVHIFYPKERSFYNLEEFYGNATPVELPFETQSQMG